MDPIAFGSRMTWSKRDYLPLIMAARSAPLKFVFSLKAATIAVSDFWQAIMRL